MDKRYRPTRKQIKAHRSKAKYILFGGSVGGAKTTWLCNEAIAHCLKHPGARGYLARHQLTSFKKTTLITLLDWLPTEWIRQHHRSENYIEFNNGSCIYYGGLGDDIRAIEKLKSLELSFYGIDQCEETTEDFFFMLNSRLRLKVPGVKYKGWLTANPTSNWVRSRFVETVLEGHEFVQALPSDNPYLPSSYISDLRKMLPEELVRIWVEGDWTAISGEASIFNYNDILESMKLTLEIPDGAKECLSCDPARFGNDSTVIMRKRGPLVTIEDVSRKSSTTETAGRIVRLAGGNRELPIKIDSIGIGAGVVDILNEQGFNVEEVIASAKAIEHTRFKNLRAEILFNVADLISKKELSLPNDEKLKAEMIASRYRIFSDGLIIAESKEEVRRRGLGSPDRLDALAILCAGEGSIGTSEGAGVFVGDYDVLEDGSFHFSNIESYGTDEKLSPETIRRNAEIDARQKRVQEEIKAKGERDLAKAQERAKKTGIITTAAINVNLNQEESK